MPKQMSDLRKALDEADNAPVYSFDWREEAKSVLDAAKNFIATVRDILECHEEYVIFWFEKHGVNPDWLTELHSTALILEMYEDICDKAAELGDHEIIVEDMIKAGLLLGLKEPDNE
jgi:hypothetical protein